VRNKGPHQAIGLYAHLTWHTSRREPSICQPDVEVLTSALFAAGSRTRIRIHAQAILADHVHLLVSYPPSACLSAFVRDAKSESARRVNESASKRLRLEWCRGFYAGSLCRDHIDATRIYLARQRQRHPDQIPPPVG